MKLLDDQELHPLVFATRMAVMAFVRATCSRSGSVCKDWFDRAGKMLYWLQRNVLSVGDYTWAREVMRLVYVSKAGLITVDTLMRRGGSVAGFRVLGYFVLFWDVFLRVRSMAPM